jgi:poly-gamma-glutamate biosynthesis protein PgsC/CapC
MLIESIAIGLVYGFFLFELTGLVAAGLVAPGYLAVSLDDPMAVTVCLLAALVTMLATRLLAMVTVLYGRRRFIVAILIGFALQWTFAGLAMDLDPMMGRLDVVGFVIPGLIAHEMDRQGPGRTLLALLLVSGLTRLTLRAIGYFSF